MKRCPRERRKSDEKAAKKIHEKIFCAEREPIQPRTIKAHIHQLDRATHGSMEEARDAIADDIHKNFWDEELQSFVQYKGAKVVDAAILLMPLVRFISPTDPKWLSTLAVIERELTVDTFVYRYRYVDGFDGLTGDEGSFTACCFWFIEALARSHQTAKARLLLEKMLGYANHVGLYAEELSTSGHHLGNFPQALTHLALISAATYLDRKLSGTEHVAWG